MKYLILLILFGCSAEHIHPNQDIDRSTITWVRVDESRIGDICRGVAGRSAAACATWQKGFCTIYVPQIYYINDVNMESLGHEVAHCFLGNYHR